MNKHILELAKQCGYWSGQTIEMNDIGIQMFAELIVRECSNIAYLCSHADCYSGDEFIHAGDKIKKHFGVEE